MEKSTIDSKSKLLTKQEAADRLRVTTVTINSYMKKGLLPFTRITRKVYFKEEDIENLINNNIIYMGGEK